MMADQAMLMPDATHPTRGLSPDPAVADSLFTFLGQRFVASYEILGCSSILNLADPVSVTADSQGVTTSVTVDTSALKAYFRSFSPYQPRDDAADSAAAQAAACTE
jgi:hypothetical protein